MAMCMSRLPLCRMNIILSFRSHLAPCSIITQPVPERAGGQEVGVPILSLTGPGGLGHGQRAVWGHYQHPELG